MNCSITLRKNKKFYIIIVPQNKKKKKNLSKKQLKLNRFLARHFDYTHPLLLSLIIFIILHNS
jgi:hypothetical protein